MKSNNALNELENAMQAALETYSNVHRGSGHNSLVSTELFDHARQLVLDHMHLKCNRYTVIFCTPFRAARLKETLHPGEYKSISSQDFNLPFGIVALVVKKNTLPKGTPFQPGGGTVKVVSLDHVLWADAPDKFEGGTPAIINVIAFAKALQISQKTSRQSFTGRVRKNISLDEIFATPEFDSLSGETLLIKLKSSLLGRSLPVPTETGARRYTNLDNGASTPTFEPIWDCARRTLLLTEESYTGIIQYCREHCLKFLNTPSSDYALIYASNTTEAINIAAMNLAALWQNECEPVIVNSILEHNSNELPWRYLPGSSIIRLAADSEGFIDLEELESLLTDYNVDHIHGNRRIRLIAITGASNVMGSFNDIGAISELAHRHGALILVDAAQLIAHRAVSMQKDGIDFLTFSAHKAYAPFGSGGLVMRKELLQLEHFVLNKIIDSGDQNVMGIVALTKIIQLFEKIGMGVIEEDERRLTRSFLEQLCTLSDLKIYGVGDPNSPRLQNRSGVVTLSFDKIPFNLAANRLAEIGGIGVRSGCFCAHLLGKQLLGINPWHAFLLDVAFRVLPRIAKNIIPGLVRISIGLENDQDDLQQAVKTIQILLNEPRSRFEQLCAATRNGVAFVPTGKIQPEIDAYIQNRVRCVFG